MDFSKQCRRFKKVTVLAHPATFDKQPLNISAICVMRNEEAAQLPASTTTTKTSLSKQQQQSASLLPPTYTYKIVVADNDEQSLSILNESDGALVKRASKLRFATYSICCTQNAAHNVIYVSDFANNSVRKFDEELNELAALRMPSSGAAGRPLSGPCGIALNEHLQQVHVVDQNHCRVVVFDALTDEYVSELALFDDDLHAATPVDIPDVVAPTLPLAEHAHSIRANLRLQFAPFGIYSKGLRIFVTDWNRALVYVYKSGKLESRIVGRATGGFTRPRDIIMDSLDNILVSDMDQEKFFFLDNKGSLLFETRAPTTTTTASKTNTDERGIFGLAKLDNKLIFATNIAVYICNLVNDI